MFFFLQFLFYKHLFLLFDILLPIYKTDKRQRWKLMVTVSLSPSGRHEGALNLVSVLVERRGEGKTKVWVEFSFFKHAENWIIMTSFSPFLR